MTTRRGNVVILDFPQAPGQPSKRRPAIVIQSDVNNARLTNSIFAMVTSNVRLARSQPTQILIDPSTPDGRSTGIVRLSAIKCENVYTLPQASIIRTIGRLTPTLLTQLDLALKASLGIN